MLEALRRGGADLFRIARLRVLPAAALGVDVAQIANSLVFELTTDLGHAQPPVAVRVAPPCLVRRGRVRIFTICWVNRDSVLLLAQT